MTTKIKRIVDEIWDIKTNITNKREESKIAFQKQREHKSQVLKLGHRIKEISTYIESEQEIILKKIELLHSYRGDI